MSSFVEQWLAKKIARQFWSNLLLAVVALMLGIVITSLTLLLTYAVTYLIAGGVSSACELILKHRFHLTAGWRWTISIGFVALLIVNAFRNRGFDFGDIPRRRYPHGAGVASGFAAFGVLLAYPGASSRIISDLLHTGPRLLLGCWAFICDALHLRRTHTADCASVLSVIAVEDDAATWEELGAARPDINWPLLHEQLKRIRGVIYLEKGITVTPELRKELRDIKVK